MHLFDKLINWCGIVLKHFIFLRQFCLFFIHKDIMTKVYLLQRYDLFGYHQHSTFKQVHHNFRLGRFPFTSFRSLRISEFFQATAQNPHINPLNQTLISVIELRKVWRIFLLFSRWVRWKTRFTLPICGPKRQYIVGVFMNPEGEKMPLKVFSKHFSLVTDGTNKN